MPAWWKGKKSKSKSASGVGRKEEEEEEEKESGFDKTLIVDLNNKGKSLDRAAPAHGGGAGSPLAHPLPRPNSSPLPRISPAAATTASASSTTTTDSSVSSCGSDEPPDLGSYRFPDQSHATRERSVPISVHHALHAQHRHLSVSPRNESHALGHRGSPPVWQEDQGIKGSGHPLPLPLPPNNTPRAAPLQNQWKKGKLLGRGTFGHVYLGFNSDNGQMCAIKEVNVISDDSNSRECLRQLNQEITLLSSLSHPNIVQYYGSELVDDALSVYLEYVSGGSIHKLLQEYGPFKEPVIRNYTAQILSGLAYLHSRNTVHRDIKGANILVDPCGDIKLADFGMAKHISAYTSVRSFKGSPYWMAPEIIMNANGYNLSVDIWSLGCTILEMATSKPPWSQYEGVAAIFKIGNSKEIPEIPEHLSAEGKHFVSVCLQRDPTARPTAAQLLDHPFVRDQVMMGNRAVKPSRDSNNAPSSSSSSPFPFRTGMEVSSRSVSPLHNTELKVTGNRAVNNASPSSSPFRTAMELSSRSISPLHHRELKVRTAPVFPPFKSSNDIFDVRANFSLPVSPCSSPLRQKQHNRSCVPSPPHPAYSAGAANYSPINVSLYPPRPNNGITLTEPFFDVGNARARTHNNNSPRKL